MPLRFAHGLDPSSENSWKYLYRWMHVFRGIILFSNWDAPTFLGESYGNWLFDSHFSTKEYI